MRVLPAVAGAVMVTGLALWVGVGGATVPDDPPAAVPAVSTSGLPPDHAGSGKARGHDKAPPPHAHGPRKPHPHGKVVPVGPRPYSTTEE